MGGRDGASLHPCVATWWVGVRPVRNVGPAVVVQVHLAADALVSAGPGVGTPTAAKVLPVCSFVQIPVTIDAKMAISD